MLPGRWSMAALGALEALEARVIMSVHPPLILSDFEGVQSLMTMMATTDPCSLETVQLTGFDAMTWPGIRGCCQSCDWLHWLKGGENGPRARASPLWSYPTVPYFRPSYLTFPLRSNYTLAESTSTRCGSVGTEYVLSSRFASLLLCMLCHHQITH